MRSIDDTANQLKIKAGSHMEGGLKRLGALFLKSWAVIMVPVGIGFMLYGLIQILTIGGSRGEAHALPFFAVGVTLSILGSMLWVLAKKLNAAAHLVRYRRQQNKIVRLALQHGGRLTITETAADIGLTVEEVEDILRTMADRGFVEMEITDSGMVVYRFPEVLFSHEKQWSRGVENA
ncbi:MAG: hypothetical protein ACKVJG_15390 [Candidatus Latescibacterota bacterium]|jgi:predicted transcriptional regulator